MNKYNTENGYWPKCGELFGSSKTQFKTQKDHEKNGWINAQQSTPCSKFFCAPAQCYDAVGVRCSVHTLVHHWWGAGSDGIHKQAAATGDDDGVVDDGDVDDEMEIGC